MHVSPSRMPVLENCLDQNTAYFVTLKIIMFVEWLCEKTPALPLPSLLLDKLTFWDVQKRENKLLWHRACMQHPCHAVPLCVDLVEKADVRTLYCSPKT